MKRRSPRFTNEDPTSESQALQLSSAAIVASEVRELGLANPVFDHVGRGVFGVTNSGLDSPAGRMEIQSGVSPLLVGGGNSELNSLIEFSEVSIIVNTSNTVRVRVYPDDCRWVYFGPYGDKRWECSPRYQNQTNTYSYNPSLVILTPELSTGDVDRGVNINAANRVDFKFSALSTIGSVTSASLRFSLKNFIRSVGSANSCTIKLYINDILMYTWTRGAGSFHKDQPPNYSHSYTLSSGQRSAWASHTYTLEFIRT